MANPADTAIALLNVLDLPLADRVIKRVETPEIRAVLDQQLAQLSERICQPDTIRLYTLMKSGTNYFRLFLANYLALLKDRNCASVTYGTLEEVLPRNSYKTFEAGNPYLDQSKYKHFVYLHGALNIESGAPKIITLHRNPLDFVVSYFHYRFKSRGDTAYETISSAVAISINIFSKTVGNWLSCASRSSHLALSYEDFTAEPLTVMRSVIGYLELPLDETLLELAAERASFRSVRAYEESNGSIHGARGQFFTRSGRVGEWRDVLGDHDIATAKRVLAKHRLEFTDETYMQVQLIETPEPVAEAVDMPEPVQTSVTVQRGHAAPLGLMRRVLRIFARA